MKRGIVGGLAAAILMAGLAVLAIAPWSHAPAGPQIGGPFALIDDKGHPVTDQDYHGHTVLIYFGYTHCPDACPTTLADIAASLDKLPAKSRASIKVLFITVDPARDTPAVMANYAHAFGPEFVGLTGSQEALNEVEDRFHVYAARHDLKGGDYAMDHSSIIYVMGPGGRFVGLVDDQLTPAAMAERLVKLGV